MRHVLPRADVLLTSITVTAHHPSSTCPQLCQSLVNFTLCCGNTRERGDELSAVIICLCPTGQYRHYNNNRNESNNAAKWAWKFTYNVSLLIASIMKWTVGLVPAKRTLNSQWYSASIQFVARASVSDALACPFIDCWKYQAPTPAAIRRAKRLTAEQSAVRWATFMVISWNLRLCPEKSLLSPMSQPHTYLPAQVCMCVQVGVFALSTCIDDGTVNKVLPANRPRQPMPLEGTRMAAGRFSALIRN